MKPNLEASERTQIQSELPFEHLGKFNTCHSEAGANSVSLQEPLILLERLESQSWINVKGNDLVL